MESKDKIDKYEPVSIKLEWQGGQHKVVELPIPFIYRTEKTGEVVCDPVGEFPVADGEALLAMGDAFTLVSYVYPEPDTGKGTPAGNYYKDRGNAAQKIRNSGKHNLVILEDEDREEYLVWNKKFYHPLLAGR